MMSLIDRDDCCTPLCRRTAVMTYLGTPMCQQCWEKHCKAEDAQELGKAGIEPTTSGGTPGALTTSQHAANHCAISPLISLIDSNGLGD